MTGIWIPTDVLELYDLSFLEKGLLAQMIALSQKDGFCSAENTYFAGLFKCANETVSRSLSSMKKLGYIKIEIDKSKGNSRKIYPLLSVSSQQVSEPQQTVSSPLPETPPKKQKAKKEIEPKKVWGEYVEGKGDGELHSMMSEFYHKNIGKYEAEMYQEFLRYWTAPIQKGAGKGKEKWRTMDTFQVSGRLATWAKNYKPKELKVNGKAKSEWDPSETLREAFAIVEAKYASTG